MSLTSLNPKLAMAVRIAGAVLGGYALTASYVPLLASALALAGMARSEAVVLSAMLGFVFYLVVLLWAFSVRSLARLLAVTTGGTALAYGLLQIAQ